MSEFNLHDRVMTTLGASLGEKGTITRVFISMWNIPGYKKYIGSLGVDILFDDGSSTAGPVAMLVENLGLTKIVDTKSKSEWSDGWDEGAL